MNPTSTHQKSTPTTSTINAPVLCHVCQKDQLRPNAWRECCHCDTALDPALWNDAPPAIFKIVERMDIWPAPVAGRA